MNRSVWYTWVAPTSGVFVLASGQYFPVPTAIYTGTTFSNLVRLTDNPAAGGIEFTAAAGVSYQIVVDADAYSFYPPGTAPVLELRRVPPPANDDFADRPRLRGRKVEATGDNAGATLEDMEPSLGSEASGRTVWWSWRAPATGRAALTLERIASTPAANFQGMLAVFTGESLDRLVQLSPTNGPQTGVNVPVVAGQDYAIAVDSMSFTSSGRFRLQVQFQATADNDDFENRRAFTGKTITTLLGSSVEENEPDIFSFDAFGSLWWSWSPTLRGVYDFSLSSDASPFTASPMALNVYRGETISELTPEAQGWGWVNYTVTLKVEGDHPRYAVRLGGSALPGVFTLTVARRIPPINDDFARRPMLRGTNLHVIGTNGTATFETGEPRSDVRVTGGSVWWQWTSPLTGLARLHIDSYSCQNIAVYAGTNVAALQEVALGEFGFVTFLAEAGQPYQIAVTPAGCFVPPWEPFEMSIAVTMAMAAQRAPILNSDSAVAGDRVAPPVTVSSTGRAAIESDGHTLIVRPPDASRRWIIESSTNLHDWVGVATNSLGTAEHRFDWRPSDTGRFFRYRAE
jgi:hypothetical protein